MTQKDKELLLKDLCARLPYGVRGVHRGRVHYLMSVNWGFEESSIEVDGYNAYFPIDSFKPYLRPMSSMTDGEKEEFDKLVNSVEERCINAYGKGGYSLAFTELNDWLDKNMFDYRGLIEKGLAIIASEKMYHVI